MDAVSRAEARCRAWSVLADWLERGPTPGSASAWEETTGVPVGGDHTRLLLLEIAPFQGVFLSAEGLVGGELADAVADARGRCGLPVTKQPDHVAEEARWVGFLAGAEADALRDGVNAEPIRALARAAFDEHFLRWLPALVAAVHSTSEHPHERAVLDLALALAWEHRLALDGAPPAWDLPAVENPLDDPKAGLGAIARHLARPAAAGGWISNAAVARLSRVLDLPAGFGTRADRIETLFGSAAHYGRVPDLCAALDAEFASWERPAPAPLDALVAPWRARRAATREMLGRIAAAARALPAQA